MESRSAPSLLALTRQNLPALRKEYAEANACARGAYEIAPAEGDAEVTLFATGSEVEIAVNAKALIDRAGHPARVVSVPCFELFEAESEEYKAELIGRSPVKVAIEAAVRIGWDRFIGPDGIFVGMHGFGASAPYEELYRKFGITAEAAAEAALTRVKAIT
jgi:transketolase